MERMVKGNICLLQFEPSIGSFTAALDVQFLDNHGAHIKSPQVFRVERRDSVLLSRSRSACFHNKMSFDCGFDEHSASAQDGLLKYFSKNPNTFCHPSTACACR